MIIASEIFEKYSKEECSSVQDVLCLDGIQIEFRWKNIKLLFVQ